MEHYKIIDNFAFFYRGCFSQWFPSKYTDEKFKITFSCAEQSMMYFKAILFNDKASATKILKAKRPEEQKALGRKVLNFNIETWNINAKKIVFRNNYFKFTQNEKLYKTLLETNDLLLVEASPYDDIWGIKRGIDYKNISDPSTWRGTNWLGEVLTEVREFIKNGNTLNE